MGDSHLVSANVRREAREYLVGWTLREIGDVFHDHGFSADASYEPSTGGERRTYVEQFYVTVDWSDREQVERMLSVFEAIVDAAEIREANDPGPSAWSEHFIRLLARDGFDRDDVGRLRPRWVSLSARTIEALPSDSAIPMLLRRMWDNVDDDPDASIGAAKEAIEATAKHVLLQTGETLGVAEKMPALIARSQDAAGCAREVGRWLKAGGGCHQDGPRLASAGRTRGQRAPTGLRLGAWATEAGRWPERSPREVGSPGSRCVGPLHARYGGSAGAGDGSQGFVVVQ